MNLAELIEKPPKNRTKHDEITANYKNSDVNVLNIAVDDEKDV